MMRRETTQNPLLPTSYDVVWWLVAVSMLIVVVTMVVTVLRSRRRRQSDASAPVEQIRQLAELRDAGAISPDEYEARKNRLLGPA